PGQTEGIRSDHGRRFQAGGVIGEGGGRRKALSGPLRLGLATPLCTVSYARQWDQDEARHVIIRLALHPCVRIFPLPQMRSRRGLIDGPVSGASNQVLARMW